MLDKNSKIERSDSVIQSEIDGEVVMMSIENGQYYGLDPIASQIWALIETPKTVKLICEELLAKYDVSREKCEADVMGFLNEMSTYNIISVDA